MYSQHVLNNARVCSHRQIPVSAVVLSPVSSGSSQSRQGLKEWFHLDSSQWMPPSAFRWLSNPCIGSEKSYQILQLLTWNNFSFLLGQPLPTVIDLLQTSMSGRGKSLIHGYFLQEGSEAKAPSALPSTRTNPCPLNCTDTVRDHTVTWDDDLTQACKKCKGQGKAGNIFNLDQFCPPISAYRLKIPFSPWRNLQQKSKYAQTLFMSFILIICLHSLKTPA